jgi:hypothetical protein
VSISTGLAVWKIAFQASPVILTGGLAKLMPGQMLPLFAITDALSFVTGLLSGASDSLDLDNLFANFEPLPGATLINQDLARYPFGNQGIAANAVIQQPLTISMRMVTPAQGPLGYFLKLAVFQALQAALYAHNTSGGTYIVMTPSFIYTNCVMRALRDTSSGATKQPQNAWTLDFEQPLITLNDIQSAQSSLMSAISNALQLPGQTPAWSAISSAGLTTTGLAGPALMPALTNSGAAITTSALAPIPGVSAIGFNAGVGPTN